MEEIVGVSNKILEVDLSTRRVEVYKIKPSERRLYLGGKGLGMKLLFERLQPGVDP